MARCLHTHIKAGYLGTSSGCVKIFVRPLTPTYSVTGIFISYRREDSIAYAGRLSDRLHSHFGSRSRVFMDVDSIHPGEDFIDRIEQTVASCDVLIAVIGKQWLSSANEQGEVRLADPKDFVHLEIRTALDRQIRLIPALVGGARMPRAQDLPTPLVALARRHAIEISDVSFHESVARLIAALEKVVAEAEERKRAAESSSFHSGPPRAQKPEPVAAISSSPPNTGEGRAEERSEFFTTFARWLGSVSLRKRVFAASALGVITIGIVVAPDPMRRLRAAFEPKPTTNSATKADQNARPGAAIDQFAPIGSPRNIPRSAEQLGLRNKLRPVQPGLSVGTIDVKGAGTVCCIVRSSDGNQYIVSDVAAFHGKIVVQPSWMDHGQQSDQIGTLTNRFQLGPETEYEAFAAVVRVLPGIAVSAEIPGLGRMSGHATNVRLGQTVRMVGRTSGLVEGTITAMNATESIVGYTGLPVLVRGLIHITKMSNPGDAGAPVLTTSNELIGMVVASGPDATVVMPLHSYFKRWNLELVQ